MAISYQSRAVPAYRKVLTLDKKKFNYDNCIQTIFLLCFYKYSIDNLSVIKLDILQFINKSMATKI